MRTGGIELIGRAIGNWQITRQLGEGSFGAVFAAQNSAIPGHEAALKVLSPELSLHADMKVRFVNEASAASRSNHENIIQVFDGGVTPDGLCYVVMELLKGNTLSQAFRLGRFDVPRTVNIGIQIASALSAAHAIQIVHRDLKPDNVFLVSRTSNPEFVKVLDFGVAKIQGDQNPLRTKEGMLIGTPAYMSPEQWKTLSDIDGRADIYALGIILYQCLTGEMPFSGATIPDLMSAHVYHPVIDPTLLAPMPPALGLLIRRMLAKRREERPQTMPEVIADLQNFGPGAARRLAEPVRNPVHAPQSISPEAVIVPVPPGPRTSVKQSTLRQATGQVRWKQPRPALLWGGVACIVLVGVGGAFAYFTRRSPPQPQPQPPGPVQPPRPPPPPPPPKLPDELVRLGRFAIGRYEVSMADYQAFVLDQKIHGPLPWEGAQFDKFLDLPVNQVDRAHAASYCAWKYRTGRLPTQQEWESTARDGNPEQTYPWGDIFDARRINTRGLRVGLLPVDSLPEGRTKSGLYHMLGNVAEWTSTDAAPRSGTGEAMAVVCGGSYRTGNARKLGMALCESMPANQRPAYVGFRCAVDIP